MTHFAKFVCLFLFVIMSGLVGCRSQPQATPIPTPTYIPPEERVIVTWYIGLGSGNQPAQIEPGRAFVRKYNNTQGAKDGIILQTTDPGSRYSRDYLQSLIANGYSPDIIGPVGTEGRGWFEDELLDLQPLLDQSQFDTSDFDPVLLRFYQTKKGLVALPFVVYPSALYYNKTLFKQAGLAEPPHRVGEKYQLDGVEVEWDFDTVAKIAKRLTLDQSGKSAEMPGFDKDKITQYGFDFQWTKDSPRWFSAYFEPHYPVKDGKAHLSAGQIDAIKWYYNGIWGDHPFIPNQKAIDGDLLKGNAFESGHLAMALTHLWYTCCLTAPSDSKNKVPEWDVAIVPSYKGTITAKLHADSFSILKYSKNPEAAFKVYQYLVGEGAAELLKIYGGLSAHKSLHAAFFNTLNETFAPNPIDTQVFQEMIPYAEFPPHELALPNIAKAHDGFLKLGSELRTDPNLNLDARIAQFLRDETAIYNIPIPPTPTEIPWPIRTPEPTRTPTGPKPAQIPLSPQDLYYFSMMAKGYELRDSGSLIGPQGYTYSAYLFFNPSLFFNTDPKNIGQDALKAVFYRWDGKENVFMSEHDFPLYENKYPSGAKVINWDGYQMSLLLGYSFGDDPDAKTIDVLKQVYYSSDISQNGLPEFAFITEYCQIDCFSTHAIELFEIEDISTIKNITQDLPGRTLFRHKSVSPFTFYVKDANGYGADWVYGIGPNGFEDVSLQYANDYLKSAYSEAGWLRSLDGQSFDNTYAMLDSAFQMLKYYEKAGESKLGLSNFLELTQISYWQRITEPQDECWLQVSRAMAQEDFKKKRPFTHVSADDLKTQPHLAQELTQAGYDTSACDPEKK